MNLHYDLTTAMRERVERLHRFNTDPRLRAIALRHFPQDVAGWVNDWGWTFDPRQNPARLPFILFDRQLEYLLWRTERLRNGEWSVTEKSRDMGVTWLNVMFQLHGWLFHPGFKGTFASRKEDLVDQRGNPDSIFEKIRFALAALPTWQRPEGFQPHAHDLFCRLINPQNGAVITGEAGDNIGRGGRSTVVDVDEAAHIDRAERIDAALSANTEVANFTSTPFGEGNTFEVKRRTWEPAKVFTFHWRQDPRKDDDWYREQKKRFPPHVVAQEIDLDYAASKVGIVIPPGTVRAALERGAEGPKEHPEDEHGFTPSYAGLQIGVDVARYGDDYSAIVVRQANVIHAKYIQMWQGETMETVERVVQVVYQLRDDWNCEPLIHVDSVGVGAGVADRLRQLNYRVVDVSAGTKAPDPMPPDPPCALLRDHLWWQGRRFFEEKDSVLTPDGNPQLVDQLIRELSMPTYTFSSVENKLRVESKSELRKRGIPSPNLADALLHTFQVKELPSLVDRAGTLAHFRSRKERKMKTTWMSK